MNNIRIAHFESGRNSTSVSGLTQWDYGQVLEIHGLDLPPAVEVHFAFERAQEAAIRIGITVDKVTRVAIPEAFLEYSALTPGTYGTFFAYVYVADEDAGQTEYTVKISIIGRAKPEAFDHPEDAELFKAAIEAVNDAAMRANTSELSAAEASLKADQSRAAAETSAVQSAQSALHADNSRQSAEAAAAQATDTLQDVGILQGRVNEDAINVAEDRAEVEYLSEQIKEDREQTGRDVEATGADRVQTGLDAATTATDRKATETARNTAVEHANTAVSAAQSAGQSMQSAQAALGKTEEVLLGVASLQQQVDADAQTVAKDKAEVGALSTEVKADRTAVEKAASDVETIKTEAVSAKTDIQDSVDGVAQELTATQILTQSEKSVELLSEVARNSIRDHELVLNDDNSVTMVFTDSQGNIKSAMMPKDETLSAIDETLGQMNESLKIIALKEGAN